MSRSITPVQFARAIQLALQFRSEGASTIVAAHNALDHVGALRDWAVPLIACLESSPAIAEAWAERQFEDMLARTAGRIESWG